jgi:hypothetical protein
MSVIISRTFTTTCNGALLEDINADVNIGPLCEQIVNDGTSTTYFYFASALSTPETTALDDKLAVWVCPALPEVVTSDELFDDTLPADPDVIWSSDKISNTFSQSAFKTISVSGQSNVVADDKEDTLTLVAGTGIGVTTNATTDTITITNTSPNTTQNLFETIAVSGQSNVVADSATDTLTLVAGTGMTITTNATTDTITFTANNNGTVTSVAATQPAAGLTISGSPITTSGTLTFALANDLGAIEALNTNGVLTRTGTDTWAARIITGTTGNITVTNGDGVGGNPTLNLATAGTAGTYATVTTDTFGRVTSGVATQTVATGGTGLTSLGTANQVLGVNAGATALEYKTLTAGSGISITHAANSVTIANTGLSFLNFAVSGQSTVVADTTNDTLTLVAGTGMTITTNATTDTITFASTGGGGTPAAPTTSIQFNNAGAFGGTARNVWDNTNNIQTISGSAEQNRLTLYDGSGTVDTAQRANAALYIQCDGDATYEGLRTYFKRSSAGISGWIAYHYDQNTPNIRLTDEDDDAPYISFSTISTGTYDNPLHVSVFGARGTYGSRDNIGDNPGFAWFIGNNTNPAALITAYQPVMELDSQWLRIPTGTTAQRPASPANGMVRYNTTTNKLEGYENGGWADLVQSTGGVFGNNFQQASNDAESSTTSSTFQQKLRMTTSSLPSGTYRIGYSVEGRCNSTSVSLALQVQINDTTTIGEALVESQDVANYDDYNGFYYFTGSGVLNIDLDYRSSSAGTTSFVRRARLEIWRVS